MRAVIVVNIIFLRLRVRYGIMTVYDDFRFKEIEKFDRAKNIALPYIFSMVTQKVGIPVFLTAVTGSYKSTIISAIERYLENEGWSVLNPDTLKVRDMKNLSEQISEVGKHRVVNMVLTDFSHCGSDYRMKTLAQFVGALSEDKKYIDYGNDMVIKNIQGLGFTAGIQPQWLVKLASSMQWDTFYRQRFLRYYMLPQATATDVDSFSDDVNPSDYRSEFINDLISNTEYSPNRNIDVECDSLKKALMIQWGEKRGKRAYGQIVNELKKWTKYPNKIAKLVSGRLGIEGRLLRRVYDERKQQFRAKLRVGATNIIWHSLDKQKPTVSRVQKGIDVSRPTVNKFIEQAEDLGFIKTVRHSEKSIVPNSDLIKFVKGEWFDD
jgi:hypothetical protein